MSLRVSALAMKWKRESLLQVGRKVGLWGFTWQNRCAGDGMGGSGFDSSSRWTALCKCQLVGS